MEQENPTVAPLVATPATVYSQPHLLAEAKAAFGVLPEVMAGALHLAGLTEATRAQAEAALEAFRTWRPS